MWDSLLEAATGADETGHGPGVDAVVLTGRLLDPAADLRAEGALRAGLDRLAAADVAVFAVTDEPLPNGLPLIRLAPDEPSETELTRGERAIAALRVLVGRATFPVPDGLPVLGVTADPAADADGCDLLFAQTGPGSSPGTLFLLPEATGAGGGQTEPRGERAVVRFTPILDLLDEPTDLPARLRAAAPRREPGERLRVVDWTLRVGAWGDSLMGGAQGEDGADALAGALARSDAVHTVTVVPHPDRFADDELEPDGRGTDGRGTDGRGTEGEEPGEAAAFLEALSHFDPLGDGPSVLAGSAPDADRIRALATRFAAPLLTAR